jgi:hypothetical protein
MGEIFDRKIQSDSPLARSEPLQPHFGLSESPTLKAHRFSKLQYSQTVMLNFNRLSWPHVTVGSLVKSV